MMESVQAVVPESSLPPKPSEKHFISIRVVFKDETNIHRCEKIPVDINNQGQSLITQLLDLLTTKTPCRRMQAKIADALKMRMDSIWLVSSSSYTNHDTCVEEQDFARVIIKRAEYVPYLSSAVKTPHLLFSAKTLVIDHLDCVIIREDDVGTDPRKALCFGKSPSRSVALCWFTVALAVSIVLGSCGALVARNLEIGLAIGGFLLTILSCLQCLILYQQEFSPG